VQHQMAGPKSGEMTHCRSMLPSDDGATIQSCPPTATSFCVTDLLANNQQKNLVQPTIHAEASPTALLPILNVAARTRVVPLLRSSIGDPPLITPLRV